MSLIRAGILHSFRVSCRLQPCWKLGTPNAQLSREKNSNDFMRHQIGLFVQQDFLTDTAKVTSMTDLGRVRGVVSPNGQLTREAKLLVYQSAQNSCIMARFHVVTMELSPVPCRPRASQRGRIPKSPTMSNSRDYKGLAPVTTFLGDLGQCPAKINHLAFLGVSRHLHFRAIHPSPRQNAERLLTHLDKSQCRLWL